MEDRSSITKKVDPMNITLDPEHGLNPGTLNCFFCNEPKEVALYGKLTRTQKHALQQAGIERHGNEAPRNLVLDKEPCGKCEGYMRQGIILISAREPQPGEDEQNPYRTGGWCVITEEAFIRIFNGPVVEHALRERCAFIADEVWDRIGLQRGSN